MKANNGRCPDIRLYDRHYIWRNTYLNTGYSNREQIMAKIGIKKVRINYGKTLHVTLTNEDLNYN